MRRANPISKAWIDAALVAGTCAGVEFSPVFSLARVEPKVYSVLTLLLGHGVILAGVSREVFVSAMSRCATCCDRAIFPITRDGLFRFAAQATGWQMRFRSTGVRFHSDNPFTQRFKPPLAEQVPNLVRHWLVSNNRNFVGTHGSVHAHIPWLAYAEFFTLLSVHPFADGNGRTARALYAVRLATNGHAVPEWLLALALSYGGNAARFHLAAQLARDGEFDDLYRNLADALVRVAPWFASDISRLERAVAADDVDAAQMAFDQIRAVLSTLMK